MEFAKGARSKFRARGQATKAEDEQDAESDPVELLVRKPATSSSTDEDATTKPGSAVGLPFRLPEDERIKRYMDAASSVAGSHHAGCASCLRAATPVVSLFVWLLVKVAPLYRWLFYKARWFYSWAPKNLLQMCFGLGLAFFGGTYVAAIAAVEAFRLMGWQRTWADLKVSSLPTPHSPLPTPYSLLTTGAPRRGAEYRYGRAQVLSPHLTCDRIDQLIGPGAPHAGLT